MHTPEVNDRATKLYNFIVEYYAEHGFSPSTREMTAALDTGSTSVTDSYVKVLIERKWLIRPEGNTARALILMRPTERGRTPDELAAWLGIRPMRCAQVCIDQARLAQIGG